MIRWGLLGVVLLLGSQVHARDGWQGRPTVCNAKELSGDELVLCRSWVSRVLQPNSQVSCCGEADAFVADSFAVNDKGETVAIITEDYPEMPAGTRVVVPPEKINSAYLRDGNPTGHGVVFIGSTGNVLCWFSPGGL